MAARELPEKFLVAFSFAGEQRGLVRSIAEAVERSLGRGTAFLDEWFEHYLAGQDADLKLQRIYGEQCELVVVCVSERYGGKPWTLAEHEAIRARVMKTRSSQEERDTLRVLPIRVGEGEVKGILFNTIVPDARTRSADETAELIVERLLLIVPDLKNETGSVAGGYSWVDTPPPPLHWPMADHSGARDAFVCLLSGNPPWRCLPLRGPSETGKSHVTRQMLANALQVRDLACGRFDFKGTTDMDAELRAFVQDLGVALPPPSARLNDRLAQILDALRQRARPALLVFDTYEAAGEAQDWVEKQLLPSLIRATWLRVVIAGQRVPADAGAVWASVARAPLQLVPPPPEDWLTFGQPYKPGITLDFVRQAHEYCGGKASLLAQLLGPAT
jgi:hypothetical protein